MNWNAQEVDLYIQQKEYIDTLVIPLVKIEATAEKMKASASSSDFLMYLAKFLEAQFKGRMMFTPPVSYTPSFDAEQIVQTIAADFKDSAFKHTFFMTTDPTLASVQLEEGQVIWLPSIPIESMEPNLKQKIMEDQLQQVLPIFTEKWAK
ncbi:MAG TPA: DUF2487 family protein [Savagea sp.]